MSLTAEQIKEVLGSSNTKPKVLTNEMKERIIEMVQEGIGINEIVTELKTNNEKVKKEHITNYLKRYLNKLLKEQK